MNIYALINNNVIENTIKADEDFIAVISNDYDYIVNITNNSIMPSIGWVLENDNTFKPPNPGENYVWNEKLYMWVIPNDEI